MVWCNRILEHQRQVQRIVMLNCFITLGSREDTTHQANQLCGGEPSGRVDWLVWEEDPEQIKSQVDVAPHIVR